ncbi:hypothetical protein RJ641_024409 [Dillenia turbinata]|uniref:Uncharacterized protein n=1 Tax=Dillenia turbinata TaxID=194707 RepID=A0AAN8YTE3_9MAGN
MIRPPGSWPKIEGRERSDSGKAIFTSFDEKDEEREEGNGPSLDVSAFSFAFIHTPTIASTTPHQQKTKCPTNAKKKKQWLDPFHLGDDLRNHHRGKQTYELNKNVKWANVYDPDDHFPEPAEYTDMIGVLKPETESAMFTQMSMLQEQDCFSLRHLHQTA